MPEVEDGKGSLAAVPIRSRRRSSVLWLALDWPRRKSNHRARYLVFFVGLDDEMNLRKSSKGLEDMLHELGGKSGRVDI